ncbi:MAG: nucleotide pyrophosphohydrolase [Rhodospirillales bacterium]|nr:nucleotide pyrophosphohydrolase [Rhodospirillales bacterium]
MLFSDYQKRARKTDQRKDIEFSTLGLALEAGNVLYTVQTHIKIADSFENYKDQLSEELGNCLWYLASLSSIFKISLADISKNSIRRAQLFCENEIEKKFSGTLKKDPDEVSHYCRWVKQTDIKKETIISVLGFLGEAGSISSITKKIHQENCQSSKYKKDMNNEIADCLWYITSIAIISGLSLQKILEENLERNINRWMRLGPSVSDHKFDDDERFPRKFEVIFKEKKIKEKGIQTLMQIEGVNVGDRLTDNAYKDDGYRYHDVFHLAYAAVLGWSPVLRSLIKRKRKSDPETDEVEDGARAIIIEEAISILIYNRAQHLKFLRNTESIDGTLLRAIKEMSQDIEVKICKNKAWEQAILMGYEVFRSLRENRGGVVEVNLDERNIKYLKNLKGI